MDFSLERNQIEIGKNLAQSFLRLRTKYGEGLAVEAYLATPAAQLELLHMDIAALIIGMEIRNVADEPRQGIFNSYFEDIIGAGVFNSQCTNRSILQENALTYAKAFLDTWDEKNPAAAAIVIGDIFVERIRQAGTESEMTPALKFVAGNLFGNLFMRHVTVAVELLQKLQAIKENGNRQETGCAFLLLIFFAVIIFALGSTAYIIS